MKEGLRSDVKYLHSVLRHRDKWYLDPYAPDSIEYIDIANKAKENADEKLYKMSESNLYRRYIKWRTSPIIGLNEGYFNAFLSDVAFDLGLKSLNTKEKALFEDSCFLTFKFI
jgi:hypothetical protein